MKSKKYTTTDYIYDGKSYHRFIFDVFYINHLNKSLVFILFFFLVRLKEQYCVSVHCVVVDLINRKSHFLTSLISFLFGLLCYGGKPTCSMETPFRTSVKNKPCDVSVMTHVLTIS